MSDTNDKKIASSDCGAPDTGTGRRDQNETASSGDPDRQKAALVVAQFAVERLNNIHNSTFGAELVKQFADYITEQATDVDAKSLRRHAANLAAQKLIDPDGWARKKTWLAAPKGHRLLKALMRIVQEADKAAEKGQ